MNRKPPIEVRRLLRNEVGFGCPVPDCSNPYLEWHHFDPPWREHQHHDPEGMIALCSAHHPQADAGAFTPEQLRSFKLKGRDRMVEVSGKFNWLRNSLLAVVGGNFYYETLTIFQVQGLPVIWLRRDEEDYLLLNIRMISTSREERLVLEDNFWIIKGTLSDFECPPSGKLIHARYANGDELRIEYFELNAKSDAEKRFPNSVDERWSIIKFPITVVEVHHQIGGTPYGFGPHWTRLPGFHIEGCFSAYSGCAISM